VLRLLCIKEPEAMKTYNSFDYFLPKPHTIIIAQMKIAGTTSYK